MVSNRHSYRTNQLRKQHWALQLSLYLHHPYANACVLSDLFGRISGNYITPGLNAHE
jgi:hypothetical protein